MIPDRLVQQDKKLLVKVATASADEVSKALPSLEALSQREAGGVFRTLATGTLERFGNVASVASTASYADMRAAALPSAKALGAKPSFTLDMDVADTVIGYAMSKFATGSFFEAGVQLATGVALAVSNTYRNNGINLANNDPKVQKYQRVASADACAFCAFAATTAGISAEAMNFDGFHDHCSCNVVPVFDGQDPFRPDYYSSFEDASAQAMDEISAEKDATYTAFRQANPDARRKDYFKAHPEAAMTTENILARMRTQGFK